nr:MAG TPA: hypothetical protein [Caudoviricetes sp.]
MNLIISIQNLSKFFLVMFIDFLFLYSALGFLENVSKNI